MADLTITNAIPVAGAANAFADLIAGESISTGDWLYRDAADSYKAKIGDALTAAKAAVVGLATHNATAGQPVRVQTAGRVTLTGPTLSVGMVYVLSGTAGTDNVAPVTDVATGHYVTLLGVASTSAILDLHLHASGILSAVDI